MGQNVHRIFPRAREKGSRHEASYAALKVRLQHYYYLEAGSMAAILGDDIAEREPETFNRLDEVLMQLVVIKMLDGIGKGAVEHGRYLKRHIVHIQRTGIRVAGTSDTSCCDHQKPFKSGCKIEELPGQQGTGE